MMLMTEACNPKDSVQGDKTLTFAHRMGLWRNISGAQALVHCTTGISASLPAEHFLACKTTWGRNTGNSISAENPQSYHGGQRFSDRGQGALLLRDQSCEIDVMERFLESLSTQCIKAIASLSFKKFQFSVLFQDAAGLFVFKAHKCCSRLSNL